MKNIPHETYSACGCCGHWHRTSYGGDCRNDAERFTTAELEEKFGEGHFWDDLAIEIEPEGEC